ncbi:NAD-dependent epimerase/dehydratase [Maribacter phage Molly_2]|uniref:NAD-dependent epimerase/dehydratase n=1 Tax=Maribacter phage Molly_1 TaxID=2745685 RepID=A0A8E4UY28_9CAUD|nr:nucleotide-sugar epimerase [Maribacter phage Molly_1]QQO97391.1 NAD-dependent epimerase/dehydratase [Maribacter phage Molly_1]QQO97591.1 NAD-dependent epimerase/dehydratase [Maribacter phage Molly_2]
MIKERILITGGAGFIGSHLYDKLTSEGFEVYVLDNFFRGMRLNLPENAKVYDVDLLKDPISKIADVIEEVRPESIFHLAAINGTQHFYDSKHLVLETNSFITDRLFKAISAQTWHVNRFIYTSTSEVYGDATEIPTTETYPVGFRPEQDRDSYVAGKVLGEIQTRLHADKLGIDYTIYRVFNTIGPRMIGNRYGQVAQEFIHRCRQGQYPLEIIGDGTETRAFCNVSDLVTLMFLGYQREIRGTYNIGNPDEVTIKALANLVMDISISETPKIITTKGREGDHKRRCPDIDKLRYHLDQPFEFNSLADTIIEMVDWYDANPNITKFW